MAGKKTTKTTKTTKKPSTKTTTTTTKTKKTKTKKTKTKQTTVAPMIIRRTPPTSEEIATRAYAIWERRGHGHGHDRDDWLAAEAELTV